MRRTLSILPLALIPLFFGAGCAEKDAASSASEAPNEEAEPRTPQKVADGEGAEDEPPADTGEKGRVGRPDAESPAELDEAEPEQAPKRKRARPGRGAASARPRVDVPSVPRGNSWGDDIAQGGEGRDLPEDRWLDEGGEPTAMFFEHYGTNPTVDTAEQPRSTFSIDVDTASYTMVRSYLERGHMPPEAAVRVEEVVNAFDYGYEPPEEATFSVHAEAAPSPNRRGYHVLHVGVKGQEVEEEERKPANLVFVIDVSGSMKQQNRLGLVKRSLRLLVDQLRESDRVGIVTYGSEARALLPPTSAHHKSRILSVIDRLDTEGATNAEAGLEVGYRMASKAFRSGSINRVVLLSDGVANVGDTGPGSLVSNIVEESKRGLTLSTVGVGMGNYNDTLMEQLANKGDGNYHYVDKLDQAREVFVERLTGTLQVIAKDVKIQVDFDPSVVERYRLIGYENRKLTAEQFDDDRVDAGEVGAGHSVTALYEVRIAKTGRPLGTVRIRHKRPRGGTSSLIEKPLSASIVQSAADDLSSPTQLSLAAAQLAEKLRGSYWARSVSYDDILERFDRMSAGLRHQPKVTELRALTERARELDDRGDPFADQHGPVARMDFDRVPVLQ